MNLHKMIFIGDEIVFPLLGIDMIIAGISGISTGINYGYVMMYAGIIAIIFALIMSFLYLHDKKKYGKLWLRPH